MVRVAILLAVTLQAALALNVGPLLTPRSVCATSRGALLDVDMAGYKKASYADRLKGQSKWEKGREAALAKREAAAAAEKARLEREAAAAAAEAAAEEAPEEEAAAE